MKCIILAAGEGIRMQSLTSDTPKPMLKISGKPILEHIINDLPKDIDEVVLVVGYLREKVIGHFGYKFGRFHIHYIVQEGKLGTFHALKLCDGYLGNDERFLLLYADDLHGADNLKKCAQSDSYAMLVFEAGDPRKFGVVELGEGDIIKGIEEKPEHPKTNLVSTGVMLLDKKIFNYPARRHPNGEHYLTDSIAQMINDGHKFRAIRSNFWLPIGYPEDLERAEEILNR